MMVILVLNNSQTFFLLFFSVTAAVHQSSVHVSGGQGSATGIRVFCSASLVFPGKESQSIR